MPCGLFIKRKVLIMSKQDKNICACPERLGKVGGQAVLEGVAFALRDSLEVAKSLGINLERTKICGGGAKSPLWKKIIANVLNLKVDVIESEEGPALGGAMLAAVACGEYANVEEIAAKMVKVVDTVEPEAELVAKYEKRYAQFKEIYPACKVPSSAPPDTAGSRQRNPYFHGATSDLLFESAPFGPRRRFPTVPPGQTDWQPPRNPPCSPPV